MAEQDMVEAPRCARMIIAAKVQAYEEVISLLELVEKYGAHALPHVLAVLRAKHVALIEKP